MVEKKRIALFRVAIRFHYRKGEGIRGWKEAENPVASTDTRIKTSATKTQLSGGYSSMVYISFNQ